MISLEPSQSTRGAVYQGERPVAPACRKMLVRAHEIGAPRARVEPLCEEAVLVDKIIAEDENAMTFRRPCSIRHVKDRLLATKRFQQPNGPSVPISHGSVGDRGPETGGT